MYILRHACFVSAACIHLLRNIMIYSVITKVYWITSSVKELCQYGAIIVLFASEVIDVENRNSLTYHLIVLLTTWLSFQYPARCRLVESHEVPRAGDRCLKFSNHPEIRQASRKQRYWVVCKCQNDIIILRPDLAGSRLCEISWNCSYTTMKQAQECHRSISRNEAHNPLRSLHFTPEYPACLVQTSCWQVGMML